MTAGTRPSSWSPTNGMHPTRRSITVSRVPTAAELKGDFSGLCSAFNSSGLCTSGMQLYDAQLASRFERQPDAYLRQQQYRFRDHHYWSGSRQLLSGAERSRSRSHLNLTNYISTQTSYPSKYPSFIIRIDHYTRPERQGQRDLLPGRPYPELPTAGLSRRGSGQTATDITSTAIPAAAAWTRSTVLSEHGARFAFGCRCSIPSGWSIPAARISTWLASASRRPVFRIHLSPVYPTAMATPVWLPGAGGQISEDTTGSLEEILTKTIKTHTIRFGFEGNLIRYNVQNPRERLRQRQRYGRIQFRSPLHAAELINVGIGADPNSGDSFADLLLGAYLVH